MRLHTSLWNTEGNLLLRFTKKNLIKSRFSLQNTFYLKHLYYVLDHHMEALTNTMQKYNCCNDVFSTFQPCLPKQIVWSHPVQPGSECRTLGCVHPPLSGQQARLCCKLDIHPQSLKTRWYITINAWTVHKKQVLLIKQNSLSHYFIHF